LTMPSKLFLYDANEANKDLLDYFKNKNYTRVALTNSTDFFWSQIDSVDNGGYLAIMSHGNNNTFEIGHGQSTEGYAAGSDCAVRNIAQPAQCDAVSLVVPHWK
ncbi:hypothetical protein, partial [Pseudomonas sp. 50_B]|uniref:hypothetical protein n=1 Tax=Pseudomonas sp. 50_B TaxID=2813574 RepID=UPI001A9FEF8D